MKSPGEPNEGRYPEELETRRKTKIGLELFLRPIRVGDEPLLRDLMDSLSDESLYTRFFTKRREVPYGQLPDLVMVDYERAMAIAAIVVKGERPEKEEFVGVGRYHINPRQQTAVVAFAVRDDYQNQGIGQTLLSYLTELALRRGLVGFTATVLAGNEAMLHVFEKAGFERQKQTIQGVTLLSLMFMQAASHNP
ncbi:MAG TPA: GNAT family N-acetyltransferase [Syntrophales bacterium]|nr:GNAT family N-acetyltransferase [Syntrophales bacterium]HOX94378.1 GNAT family N-acetyltransferase [Syntrophales bacterium]HPI57788.1 GNAT family N-acetyltransferase [Syntrophales bacterium]HPN24973.1 GNAT family N-acetyltransferase [Syntrophales bacterium]HQM29783.1 GNAT family N-acetyltransferase [Syntrophales bacterium]